MTAILWIQGHTGEIRLRIRRYPGNLQPTMHPTRSCNTDPHASSVLFSPFRSIPISFYCSFHSLIFYILFSLCPPPPNLIFHLTLPLFTLFSFLQLSISLFRYFSPHISVTLFTILSPHFSLFSYLPLSVSPFTFHTASSTLVSFLSILYFLIFPSTCLLFNIASSTLLRSVSIYLSLSLTSSVSSPILLHSLTL